MSVIGAFYHFLSKLEVIVRRGYTVPMENRPTFFGEVMRPIEKPRSPEGIKRAQALYLAGIFEAGASLSANVWQGEDVRVQTCMSFSDSDKETILKMVQIFGGRHEPSKQATSHKWLVTDSRGIANLIDLIYSFAPSRRDQFDVFLQLDDIDGPFVFGSRGRAIKKIPTVEEFNKTPRDFHLSPEAYSGLVSEPAFLAGVRDSRGHPYSNMRSGLEQVYMSSKNIGLVNALYLKFVGEIPDANFRNTNSKAFVVSNGAAHGFLHLVEPYRIKNLPTIPFAS